MNKISAKNNPVLQKIAMGYQNDSTSFIIPKLFPSVVVDSLQGDIKNYGRDNLRIINTIQGDGPSAVLTHTVTKATKWDIEKHSLRSLVTEKDMDQLGADQAKADFTEMNMETLMLSREYAGISAITTTGNYVNSNTVTLVGNQKWSDHTNSTPKSDLRTARERVRTNIGKYPNTAVMNAVVLSNLIEHPSMIQAAIQVGQDSASLDRLKAILFPLLPASECDILVAMSQYNSANKGQTAVMADVMGNHFVYAYVNKSPSPKQHQDSLGYSFNRGKNAIQVKTWIDEDLDPQPWVKDEWEYDDVVLTFKAGYLIYNAA